MKTVRIRIEGSARRGYLVQLRTGAEGEAAVGDPSEPIAGDLDAAAAPDVLRDGTMQTAVRDFVHAESESADFPAIGDYLASLLLARSVGEAWDALKRENANGLRTLLEIEAEELRAVPWELVYRGGRRLFIDDSAVFARVHQLRPDTAQDLVPLRLLVVEGPQDDEGDELGAATEVRGIKSALPAFKGRIDAEFIREPTKEDLLKALERVRPHIFHFMGHGVVEAGGEPALRVGGWPLTRQFVLESLTSMPRVAVLNACRSGEGARAGSLTVEQVRGLTDAFLSSGAAAAVGMQGDIRGRAAGLFGTGFYDALAEDLPVDQAVAAARKRMVDFADNAQARDWCLPSLTLGVLPEQVLPLACGIEEEDRERVEANLFTPIGLFVDRMPTRWELAKAADPDDRKPARLVRVVGDMEAGKTWLVHWIRTRCALRGRRVRYVDFKAQDNLDFVRTLEIIRDTPEDVASLAAPAVHAFDRFTFDLGFLVNGQIPPEEAVAAPPPVPDRLQLGGENEERVFQSFCAALEAAAGENELILIFDHVDGILKTDFQTRIFRHLIVPLVDGKPPNVRLIVVLSNEQQRAYWPADAGTVGVRVEVKLLNREEYEACAEEIVLAMGKEFGEGERGLISGIGQHRQPPVSPKHLRVIETILAGN